MVFDSLKNAKLYTCLGERFEKAFDYLLNTDLSALPVGKMELDGKKLYEISKKCAFGLISEGEGLWSLDPELFTA